LRTLRIVGVVGVACVVACGCGIGPRAIRRERASYNIALQQTASEQMLLNLVRLKYREPTLFLEVGSISAHFEYLTEIEGIGTFVRGGADAYTGRLMPSYSEQPTITYAPLQGEAYVSRIIAEVTLSRLGPLYSGGWHIDRMLRILLERAGDLRNDPKAPAARDETRRPYEKLMEVAQIWRELQKKGDIAFLTPMKEVAVASGLRAEQVTPQCIMAADKEGYRFCPGKDGTWELRKSCPCGLIIQAAYAEEKDADAVDAALKIKPARTRDRAGRFVERIRLTTFSDIREGGESAEIAEVPVQVRSLNGILFYLGQGVEVPTAHLAKGLVKAYKDEQGKLVDRRETTRDLLDVHCSATRPADAYVAVRYRGHWFYVADSDVDSKDTFSLLLILFALQSGDVKSAQPLLTIPVGGR